MTYGIPVYHFCSIRGMQLPHLTETVEAVHQATPFLPTLTYSG